MSDPSDTALDAPTPGGTPTPTPLTSPIGLAPMVAGNPLRDPRDRRLPRVPEPCALVVFGVTGDLARKKLLPAIYDLANRGLLPPDFVLLGFARRDWGDGDFENLARKSSQEHARTTWNEEVWKRLCGNIKFVPGAFDDDEAFDTLGQTLDDLRASHGVRGNAAFYLSIPPRMFPVVLRQMERTGMASNAQSGGWRRVVVEKPFGHDLASALELNGLVDRVFTNQDVFRIDHYLGKETVRNLLVFRFGNGIFQPLWNRRYVDHVQITVAESIGIENRGAFYEQTGASRDVLQNHLLQLVSLVAMEPPATFEANALRDEKVKVLRAIEITPADVSHDVVRGQYGPGWVAATQVPGYRSEPDVDTASETETFIAAKLMIDDWRWSGVPFYVRTGKRLPKRATEIAIQYREVPHRLFKDEGVEPDANLLAIRIQPDEGIMLRFGAKVPGLGLDVRSVTMDFTYGSAFSVDSPDAYETLILDALQGDASLFTRADEVEEAWSIVDPIIDSWASGPAPDFPNYDAGTWGPPDADELIARDGRHWRRI